MRVGIGIGFARIGIQRVVVQQRVNVVVAAEEIAVEFNVVMDRLTLAHFGDDRIGTAAEYPIERCQLRAGRNRRRWRLFDWLPIGVQFNFIRLLFRHSSHKAMQGPSSVMQPNVGCEDARGDFPHRP